MRHLIIFLGLSYSIFAYGFALNVSECKMMGVVAGDNEITYNDGASVSSNCNIKAGKLICNQNNEDITFELVDADKSSKTSAFQSKGGSIFLVLNIKKSIYTWAQTSSVKTSSGMTLVSKTCVGKIKE